MSQARGPVARPGRLRLVVRWLMILFAAVGFLAVVVTFTPLVRWWGYALAGRWTDPKGDVLIVLAGSQGPRGMIGYDSYLRSEYALLAYQQDGFHSIVVSGGGDPPEGLVMRNFLQCQGIPAAAITSETASTSTRENALFTKKLIDAVPGRKVLLTSDYHMYRAYRVFRKAGMDVQPRPFPDVIKRSGHWQERWWAFMDLLTETTKIGYYTIRGWM